MPEAIEFRINFTHSQHIKNALQGAPLIEKITIMSETLSQLNWVGVRVAAALPLVLGIPVVKPFSPLGSLRQILKSGQ